MSEPYLAELKLVPWSYAPPGWAKCDGQLLPINQNQALFALLGTMYGGNAQTNFALPDLRGRVPMHFGTFIQGTAVGEEAHTITLNELPAHNHVVMANNTSATQASPAGAVLASSANMYAPFNNPTTIHPSTLTNVGGSQPHENHQPYLVLNWIIALQGIFPSRN